MSIFFVFGTLTTKELATVRARADRNLESLKFGNVWIVVQLIHRPTKTKHQLYRNTNIARLHISSSGLSTSKSCMLHGTAINYESHYDHVEN